MQIFQTTTELNKVLKDHRSNGSFIGFVPTMGALHRGHMALIREAKSKCGLVVCSIFVNPTQFNDVDDLKNYPSRLEEDVELLEGEECDYLFYPSVDDVYPHGTDYNLDFDLGYLDETMEGKFRPGHFLGVAQVMHSLLKLVNPTHLFMGMKDFQQVAVVQKLIDDLLLNVEMVPCDTVREADGLAMSSRNLRLDPEMRKKAAVLFETLQMAKIWILKFTSEQVSQMAIEKIRQKGLKPEYFELVDPKTLLPICNVNKPMKVVACVAAYAGAVRLIDNMVLKA